MYRICFDMSHSPRTEVNDARNSDEKLEQYEHEELRDAHSIRLIKLRPAGSKSNEVECELITADLDTFGRTYGDALLHNGENGDEMTSGRPHSYEALSWSWGGEAWDHEVRIHHTDGVMYYFPVPKTLVDAFKAMRSAKRVRYLWVDVICIDQANANEKNRQGKLNRFKEGDRSASNASYSTDDVSNIWSRTKRLRMDW